MAVSLAAASLGAAERALGVLDRGVAGRRVRLDLRAERDPVAEADDTAVCGLLVERDVQRAVVVHAVVEFGQDAPDVGVALRVEVLEHRVPRLVARRQVVV
jgi:hypothetical protein